MTPRQSPAPSTRLSGAELCVHCGFCLQACPTYLVLGDENDSPRGRIVLMKAIADGAVTPQDADARLHVDRCLGCRSCETACPSGVPYGQLLEATRETISAVVSRPLAARLVLFAFARAPLLSMAMWCARLLRAAGIARLLGRLPGTVGFSMAMLASTRRRRAAAAYTPDATATGETVATLRGCVMEGLFAPANRATERTLVENGYRLVHSPGQVCCGALHAHAGDLATARALAMKNIASFEKSGARFVAANSAGCGSMMKEYAHLLRDHADWRERASSFVARVRDVSELLVAAGPKRGARLNHRVTYDAPCHLQHGQRIVSQPLAVLGAIPLLEVVPLADSDQCCGSAGIYSLVQPGMSSLVLSSKLACVAATGAQFVVTGNPGCLMQIGAGLARAGMQAEARHPVELLDASYAALHSGAADDSPPAPDGVSI